MNELKRELSKLSGIDFFNPKFRDVFKKYFPDDKDAEEEKLEQMGIEEETEEVVEDNPETMVEDKLEEVSESETDTENDVEDMVEEKADTEEEAQEVAETIEDEAQEIQDETVTDEEIAEPVEEVASDNTNNLEEELYDVKIENELRKLGVRDDKIEPAKRMAKYEIAGMEDLARLGEIVKQYPEWTTSYRPQGFGMSVDEGKYNLTEEEKRLKQMGIDPRD